MVKILKELCEKRGLMPVPCRKDILALLQSEEYGYLPLKHDSLEWKTESENHVFCAGKVTLSKVILTAHFGVASFSFPIYTSIPNTKGRHPFFVHINFTDGVPDKYLPAEEICDSGFAVVSFCYKDVTSDNADFTNGLSGVLFNDGKRQPDSCGKLMMWSWAASRALDYALTLDTLDDTRTAVVGHSRLGKTALLTGALDERFACTISNDSGCSGAALSRGKSGETIKKITDVFPYWFCENYYKYADNEDRLPFDQHFLIAAIAPRKVYVASAKEDLWADPESEFLSCFAASESFTALGLNGLVSPDCIPKAPSAFHGGNIGYHIRFGTHYFSREDWQQFIKFLK